MSCQHARTTEPLYNGGNYGNYGTQRCLDCGAVRDDWSDWHGGTDLHELGTVCVDCSHEGNIEVQKRIFHPAYRGCVLAPEKESERRS